MNNEGVMGGVLENVNKRTQMVGQNRLELLLFRLGSRQIYGINVFKVKEVLHCPKLTKLPHQHNSIVGMAHVRGETIPVMDMDYAIGGAATTGSVDDSLVIITEYNMSTQGFLVKAVERIVNLRWEDMHPPPKGAGNDCYLTAVTELENKIIEIIDVEKILAEVSNIFAGADDVEFSEEIKEKAKSTEVMVVDDSSIARKQICKVVEAAGATVTSLSDGRQAYDYLKKLSDDGIDVSEKFALIISDIEMPEMDGYTLTAEIRNDPVLKDLHVILHTSLSGVFNQAMVEKVGADDFLAKFNPDLLADRVRSRIEAS